MAAQIFITCPQQNTAVWTGFRAPPGTGLSALTQVTLQNCPACGHAHIWDGDAAFWQETAPLGPAAMPGSVTGRRRPVARGTLIAAGAVGLVAVAAIGFGVLQGSPTRPAPSPAFAPPGPAPATGPQFDVLRVDPSGNAVIAGRAEPAATVTIKDGGDVLGMATADDTGSFAFVPQAPLPAGAQQLALSEQLPGGRSVAGQTSATVDVPVNAASQPLAVISGPQGSRIVSGQGPAPGSLAIGSADYDAGGQAVFSGTAPAGDKVSLSLDGTPLGTATGGPDGSWSIAANVSKNRGTLALIDTTDPTHGPQTAPFAVETLKHPVQAGHVVVAPGQNLWIIARQVYGRGMLYTLIYKANTGTIHDPRVVFPGQDLVVPELPPDH